MARIFGVTGWFTESQRMAHPRLSGMADQPDGICWVVFDAKVEDIPRWNTSIRRDQPALNAPTNEALADTMTRFNAACPTDDGAFEPLKIDHRATRGLAIEKSWSRPINRGPFRPYPIIPTNCFTFGGLKVNADAQVLDQDGRVMDVRCAASETMGS